MAITTREARQLTTVAEWPVVQSSLPGTIREHTPARLESKAARARKLWTKYADLVKRQQRASKLKRSGAPSEALNARTRRKTELFAEVFARYEARLSALKEARLSALKEDVKGSKSAKSAKSAKTRKAAKAQGKARGIKPGKKAAAGDAARRASALREARADARVREASEVEARRVAEPATSVAPPQKVKETRAPAVLKSDVHKRSGQMRIQAHVSSQGRRRQGKRDSR